MTEGLRAKRWWPAGVVAVLVLSGGCSESMTSLGEGSDRDDPDGRENADLVCSIPKAEIFNGGPGQDGIPALSDPTLVTAGEDGASYLLEGDRVVGVALGGEAVAVPLNVLWWHEIVNVEVGGQRVAITHCPLTGSSLVFDREPLDGVELGVSGLLYRNNLIMYDRTTDQSLWPQMLRGARCGTRDGTGLTMVPAVESTWQGWRVLHPSTKVVSSETGYPRDYRAYPYGDYDEIDNRELLFPGVGIDPRRPPKERVLGIPSGEDAGTGYPFGELESLGAVAAVQDGEIVVFWDRDMAAAMAYRTELDGASLRFTVREGSIVDLATGSIWRIDGVASAGPMEGRSLEPVAEAYVAFWFAWAVFHPHARLWEAP